ncbi:hypothetical protein FOFC_10013, partial [Fusarium oxysporum]
ILFSLRTKVHLKLIAIHCPKVHPVLLDYGVFLPRDLHFTYLTILSLPALLLPVPLFSQSRPPAATLLEQALEAPRAAKREQIPWF